MSGAGLVVYTLETDRIEDTVAQQINQELAEFEGLRGGDDPKTGEPFATVSRLIRLFLKRNVPDDDELLVGYLDGAPEVRSENRYAREFMPYQPFQTLVDRRQTRGGTERLETDEWGTVIITVQPARDRTSTGALVVVHFLDDEFSELNQVMQTYAIIALLSLALVTAVAGWQSGRLLRPVRVLRENAQQISESDLSRRIPETGNDDITALTRTFNEMLGRLDRAFTGQREFLDDAGHELKTPLTIIQGHMEVLDATDPADIEDTKELLLDEIGRMSRLVNDLIMLAKTDRPGFFVLKPVNVAPFTKTVLDKCRALGDRDWQLDATAQFLADMDEQRITQALLQLAQNAVKHTKPGDEIAIGSQVDAARGLRLWVRDCGPGVADDDKSVIFERFGRAVVPEGDEGFGLGLSIVSAIVHAHGGTATVEDAMPHGSRFVLTLPVDRPARRESEPWPAS
jgi:signal transduction histidine kinase